MWLFLYFIYWLLRWTHSCCLMVADSFSAHRTVSVLLAAFSPSYHRLPAWNMTFSITAAALQTLCSHRALRWERIPCWATEFTEFTGRSSFDGFSPLPHLPVSSVLTEADVTGRSSTQHWVKTETWHDIRNKQVKETKCINKIIKHRKNYCNVKYFLWLQNNCITLFTPTYISVLLK